MFFIVNKLQILNQRPYINTLHILRKLHLPSKRFKGLSDFHLIRRGIRDTTQGRELLERGRSSRERGARGIEYYHVAFAEFVKDGAASVAGLREAALDAFDDVVSADGVYPVSHPALSVEVVAVISSLAPQTGSDLREVRDWLLQPNFLNASTLRGLVLASQSQHMEFVISPYNLVVCPKLLSSEKTSCLEKGLLTVVSHSQGSRIMENPICYSPVDLPFQHSNYHISSVDIDPWRTEKDPALIKLRCFRASQRWTSAYSALWKIHFSRP